MTVQVLFVCAGNICRSPMAEAIFHEKVRQAGLDNQIVTDSCGTGDWHSGDDPHPGTRRILDEHGIPYHHAARQITRDDLATAHYLIVMDNENLTGVRLLGQTSAEVGLLLSYAPNLGLLEVPDPYFSNRFDETYRLIDTGCTALLGRIREREGL